MEFFPDQTHVRLLSRADGTYLHADEDGCGVSLSPHRASLNTAWAVHLRRNVYTTYVLLHGAAYGRYLALWRQPAPPQGHDHLSHPVQSTYDTPMQANIMWEVHRTDDGNDDVGLRNAEHGFAGLPLWAVEAIPPRPLPPGLPEFIPNGVHHPVLRRTIRYIQGDNSGMLILPWRTFPFDGRSLIQLRGALAAVLPVNANNMTLCVRAGFHGRRTPLVIDLPNSLEPMDIIVLTTDSPAALELRHPDVDAE